MLVLLLLLFRFVVVRRGSWRTWLLLLYWYTSIDILFCLPSSCTIISLYILLFFNVRTHGAFPTPKPFSVNISQSRYLECNTHFTYTLVQFNHSSLEGAFKERVKITFDTPNNLLFLILLLFPSKIQQNEKINSLSLVRFNFFFPVFVFIFNFSVFIHIFLLSFFFFGNRTIFFFAL